MLSKVTTNVEKEVIEFFDPAKTGDAYPKKVCNICQRLLDTTKFSKNQTGLNNRTVRRPSCDDCRVVIDGVDPPKSETEKWAKKKPLLMPFECPICKKITIPGLTSKVVLVYTIGRGNIVMVMYNLCERCGNEIVWETDFADYVAGYVLTMSLEQQNGVFINSKSCTENWCNDCIVQHAKYEKKTQLYSAL